MYKSYVNISIQSSAVSQQLQKKRITGLWDSSAVLRRTFKKFGKSDIRSASPKPRWVTGAVRGLHSLCCVQT